MFSIHKLNRLKIPTFFGLFFSMLFWLPTAVGSWLVHFEVISDNLMWAASMPVSAAFALYWTASD